MEINSWSANSRANNAAEITGHLTALLLAGQNIRLSAVMSGAPKTRWFLSSDGISELVWNSESEDTETSSDSMSEDEGVFQDEPGVSHLQPDRPTSSGQASSSSISTSASDGFQSGSGQQWTRSSGPQRGVVHTFTEGPRRKRNTEALHINDSSSPLSIFLLYFAEIIILLVVETNRYYHAHLET